MASYVRNVSLKISEGFWGGDMSIAPSKFKCEKYNYSLSAQDQKLIASCLGGGQVISEVTRVQGAVQREEDGISFKGKKDERKGDKPRCMFQLKTEEAVGRIHYFCALPDNDGSIEALVAKVTLHRISSSRRTRFSRLPIFDETTGEVRFISWREIGQRVAFASHSMLSNTNERVALKAP